MSGSYRWWIWICSLSQMWWIHYTIMHVWGALKCLHTVLPYLQSQSLPSNGKGPLFFTIFNSRHSEGHCLCWWHCHEMGGQLGERGKGGRMLQMLQNWPDLNVTWRFCWPILIAQKLSCILVGSHTDMKVWPASIRVFLKNPLMAFGDCGMALAEFRRICSFKQQQQPVDELPSYCWG